MSFFSSRHYDNAPLYQQLWDTFRRREWVSLLDTSQNTSEAEAYIDKKGPVFVAALFDIVENNLGDDGLWICIPTDVPPHDASIGYMRASESNEPWRFLDLGPETHLGHSSALGSGGTSFTNRHLAGKVLSAVLAQVLIDSGYTVNISGRNTERWYLIVSK